MSENNVHTSESERTKCLNVIVKTFALNRMQQSALKAVVCNAIQGISKLRDDKGHPIRWCFLPTLPIYQGVVGTCLAMDFGCSDHYIKFALWSAGRRANRTTDSLKIIDTRAFILTPSIRQAEMSSFCDFVAICIKKMLNDNGVECTGDCPTVYMGVAAGFDVRVYPQKSPASATVRFASKDFRMNGFIGNDFVPQFHEAFNRIDLKVEIVTVINDTAGILLSGVNQAASSGVDCSIGLLCHRGGSNLAYLESNQDFLDACSLDERLLLRRPNTAGHCVVVNSESGYSIGEKNELKIIQNFIDQQVMKELNSPFRLECVISGSLYSRLLEKCILILLKRKAIDARPYDESPWALNLSNGFETFALCDAWCAGTGPQTREALAVSMADLLGLQNLTVADAAVIVDICKAIIGRTVKVTALSVVAIAQCVYGTLFPAKITVAYGGSLFTTLTQLKKMLQKELDELTPDGTDISLLQSDVSMGCAATAISAGLTI